MTITRESLRTAVVLAKFFLLTVFISLVIRIGLPEDTLVSAS